MAARAPTGARKGWLDERRLISDGEGVRMQQAMERATGRPKANGRCWSPVGPTASAPTSPASPPSAATACRSSTCSPPTGSNLGPTSGRASPRSMTRGRSRRSSRSSVRPTWSSTTPASFASPRSPRRGSRSFHAVVDVNLVGTFIVARAAGATVDRHRTTGVHRQRHVDERCGRRPELRRLRSVQGGDRPAHVADGAGVGPRRGSRERGRPRPDRRRHVGADLRRSRHALRPGIEDPARPTRHRGRRRRGRPVPGVRARRLRPWAEHPGRRGRHGLGDRHLPRPRSVDSVGHQR